MRDERRLQRALARRDRDAWSATYDRHVQEVFGLVYHLVGGDRILAEEIHQEVWLAALEGFDHFDVGRGRFRDWLMGMRGIGSRATFEGSHTSQWNPWQMQTSSPRTVLFCLRSSSKPSSAAT